MDYKLSKTVALPDNPLRANYQLPDAFNHPKPNQVSYAPIPLSDLNPLLIAKLYELGQTIGGAILFKKNPGMVSVLHSDILLVDDQWVLWHGAINWNITRANSCMEWYASSEDEMWPSDSRKDPGLYNIPYVLDGIHYGTRNTFRFNSEKNQLLESRNIQAATLVRTDIPHRIRQTDDEKIRWSLSLRLAENHSWEDFVKIFEPVWSE